MEVEEVGPQCKQSVVYPSLVSQQNNYEINRLILQYLSDQGHQDIAQELEKKTGLKMESEMIEDFKTKVLNGDFNEAAACVKSIMGQEKTDKEIEFLIQQQHFLELLCESNQTMKAVVVLQKELTPKAKVPEMAHNLAKLLTCKKEEEIKEKYPEWKGKGLEGRKQVLEQVQLLLPKDSMLQPRRLEVLLRQSLEFQIQSCNYQNKQSLSLSLLSNHVPQKIQTPVRELCKIKRHKDEVWLVKFSNCGSFFATVGADRIVIVWELKEKENGYKVVQKTSYRGNDDDVHFVSWTNQSSKWIISGGKTPKQLLVWKSNTGEKIVNFTKHQDQVQQAQFLQDDERVISCSSNRQILLWRVTKEDEGHSFQEITTLESKNSLDLAIAFQKLVLVGTQGTVIIADFKQEQAENCLSFENKFLDHKKINLVEPVNSICLSPDGKQLLVNISTKEPKMILYDIETCQKLAEFQGHKQPSMVLKASISKSPFQNLVSIGSEDQVIRIWHKERGDLLKELKGHNLPVNAVAFSPKKENLLISVSDDTTIRFWGKENMEIELAKHISGNAESIPEEQSEEAKESEQNNQRESSYQDYGSEDSEENEDDESDMDLF